MLHPCIICTKLGCGDPGNPIINPDISGDSIDIDVKNEDVSSSRSSRKVKLWTIDQFFKFLVRYLYSSNSCSLGADSNSNGGQEANWALLEKVIDVIDINNGTICCKDCSKIVETFCELYDQMKTVELHLNRQVQTLEEVMVATVKVKTEYEKGSDFFEGGDESSEVVLDFKRSLLKRCRLKLETSSPRLTLIDISKDKSKGEMPIPPKSGHESSSLCEMDDDLDDDDYCPSPSSDSDANSEDGTDKSSLHLDLNEHNTTPVKIVGDTGHGETNESYNKDQAETEVARSSYNSESGKHKCSYCSKEFKNRGSIFAHFRHVHSRRPFKTTLKCGTCGEVFKFGAEYNRHRRKAHPAGKTFTCNLCGEAFKLKRLLKVHQQNPCKLEARNQLNQEATTAGASSKPKTEAIPEPQSTINPLTGNFQCLACSKEFLSNNSLQLHFDSQHRNQRYHCATCNQSYKSRGSYQRHQRIAHKGIRFNCPKCQKPFTEKNKLRLHQRYCGTGVIKVKPQRQKCSICDKEVSRSSLQLHMKYVHYNSREHLCSHCGKGFVIQGNLAKHVKSVHLQLRDHLCDLCGKGFKNNSNLRIHRLKIHSTTE